jgi:hypothetical protein
MTPIDKIIFGDNQFFGINHMSQEKAQQLSEQFYNIENIFSIYNIAIEAGIKGIMLNSNQRAGDICDYFRKNEKRFSELNWYPSIPYPHKYANLVSEKGIFPAINEVLFSNNSALGILGMLAKGSSAVLNKDVIKVMQMLIDVEVKMFKGLNIRAVFLQNVITDLLLGYGIKEIFEEYCAYIENKHKALPGFITQNLPYCLQKLKEWKIENVVICTSFNKLGYLMSPSRESYESTAKENDPSKYQIIAMSALASGAIPVKEAISYVANQNVQSIVFGASSQKHINDTVRIISQCKV